MNDNVRVEESVSFEVDGIRIQGKSELLLCASLFYFRIPRADWRERMEQLSAFGYNAIDVYFPWNYHERKEGIWEFQGERDVAAFLQAAKDCGLWVVARPGPYICSEWDGGALPAYLLADETMRLRDNEPRFLAAVSRWMDAILPILSSYQVGHGGTIIAMQLDNELDFYGCMDPAGYMTALRDMAIERGITVPLFACAGQGGIREASGLVEGVMPTCNFYPNDRDPAFEHKVRGYGELLSSLGYPLLVTETNRSHYLLRRLLSCGAKLLGPYLQVSGTDFGFNNATNNWGKPLAFLTSDYDFHGMISPEGHIREEAYEGRLLRRLMDAYGSAIAEAKVQESECRIGGESDGIAGPFTLALHGGGSLVFVTNLDDSDKQIRLLYEVIDLADSDSFILSGGRSLALPVQVPLNRWGMEGVLRSSTSELYRSETLPSGGTVLFFHKEGPGEIRLSTEESIMLHGEQGELERAEKEIVFKYDAARTETRITLKNEAGNELTLIVHNREDALLAEKLDVSGIPQLGQRLRYTAVEQPAVKQWRQSPPCTETPSLTRNVLVASDAEPGENAQLERLEKLGVYRGYAWYEGSAGYAVLEQAKGILVRQAGDVVSLYAGNSYMGTTAPGGGSRYLVIDDKSVFLSGMEHNEENVSIRARVEIWGHSNFDDIRLPALRLNAGKGLGGATVITRVASLNQWRVHHGKDHSFSPELVSVDADRSLWPVVSFGGWLSPDHPAFELYNCAFAASPNANAWTLRFEGLQARAKLFVGGVEVCDVNPFDPFVDITSFVTPGGKVELTVFLESALGLPAGVVELLEGVEANGWRISAAEETELLQDADDKASDTEVVHFPLLLQPGAVAWLFGEAINSSEGKGWRIMFEGTGLKLTVFLKETIIARIWLPGGVERPVVTGGSQQSGYVPGAWLEEGTTRLAIMVEAVDPSTNGRLDAITFHPVQQPE
ncbi:beta-galactosidase [Paenibacillus sp. strain BS8-2]